jgi:hypothetical protein
MMPIVDWMLCMPSVEASADLTEPA